MGREQPRRLGFQVLVFNSALIVSSLIYPLLVGFHHLVTTSLPEPAPQHQEQLSAEPDINHRHHSNLVNQRLQQYKMGSLPVTPRRDNVFRKESIVSWVSQSPLETKPDISPVRLNNKRKLRATSPCERPRKARKGTNRQPLLSSRICVKEDDEDANTSNGGWDESELDKNLKQLSLTTLKSWDDPFVGAHPRPPPRNKNGSTATKSTNTDIRKKKQRLREATLARMEQINEKLQPWENGESIMTRAQAQEVDRLCDEYSLICAALPPPQDLSPSGSSALPHSHSYLNNNTDHYSDSHRNTSDDIRKKKQRLREATLARMEQINEKLQPWENCARIPTRAQAQEVDRLCDEYYQICAALPPPQDLSPSGSSALPHSHSSYLNNNTDHYSDSYNNTSGDSSDTNSGTNPGTNSGPIDWIMALRTKEDFEKYHEHQKIKFGRKDPEDYNLMDMDSVQLNRRGREEMLSVVLGNKKGRLGKYWDWLAQRSGEMDREMELNGPTRHTRVPTRSPSNNFTGFYEKFVRHYGH